MSTRIIRHFAELPSDLKGGSVALGNFDGVHKGHQAVIGHARAIAENLDVPLGVMTFEPHPRRFFQPDLPAFTLSSFRLKTHQVTELDADFLYVQQFDKAFSSGTAEWFVREVLVAGLAVSHVVIGHDYRFGHRRQGNAAVLEAMAAELGFGVTAVAPVQDDSGAVYSSTRVRDALQAGDVAEATAVLGRPWEIEGRVEHGDKRGRTIGFPTANIRLGDYQHPRPGVYAITAGVDEGFYTRFRPGVANFGRRPTFDKSDLLLEVHLFDTDVDLYGKHLRVRFHHFLRPEQTFSGLEALKAQIAADAIQARDLLREGA